MFNQLILEITHAEQIMSWEKQERTPPFQVRNNASCSSLGTFSDNLKKKAALNLSTWIPNIQQIFV